MAVVLERRGVEYFKDRQLRASYGVADGLGKGQVPGIQLDEDGALWGATEGGISRIKDGHIDTLTSQNGLLCDTIHWTMRDDSGALWAYAACGLFRIGRTELETWIAQPTRRIETSFWDAADGVHLRMALGSYGPFTARSVDGKLWFLGAESQGSDGYREIVVFDGRCAQALHGVTTFGDRLRRVLNRAIQFLFRVRRMLEQQERRGLKSQQ